MMNMVMYIANDLSHIEGMIDVWTKAGVRNLTILDSVGLQEAIATGTAAKNTVFPSMAKLLRKHRTPSKTIFSILDDTDILDKAIAASNEFTNNWTDPESGVLLVLPVAQAYGLDKNVNAL